MQRELTNSTAKRWAAWSAAALFVWAAPQAGAVVVFSDDFEDADRDNDGVVGVLDVDVNVDGEIGTWNSANPDLPTTDIPEVSDPGLPTSGLTWFSSRGFTGDGKPKFNVKVVDDSAGGPLPDSAHINSGLALGMEGVGRSSSATGFFDPTPTPGEPNDQRLALGLDQGDRVKMSFDWRIWESTPAQNSPNLPNLAQLRFGLFQDTDNQLGESNPFAGPGGLEPAVWGQEDGFFRGDLGSLGAGAQDDHGIFAKLFIGEQNLNTDSEGEPLFSGDLNRIVQETNEGGEKFLEGSDQETIASPPKGDIEDPDSFFPLLQIGTVYRISLELERAVAAASQGDPEGLITTTVTVDALDAAGNVVSSHSFGDTIDPPDPADDEQNGVQSDVWDYVGFRNSSGDPEQDFDFIIDNVLFETFEAGGGLVGDLNGDGFVGAGDLDILLGVWNQNVSDNVADLNDDGFIGAGDLDILLGNWNAGTAPGGSASVIPEPATLGLLTLGGLVLAGRRR